MQPATKCLGILALLFSSASNAARVTIIQSGFFGDFTLTIHGENFPQTAGATLGLSFNSAQVSFVSAALPTTGPWAAAGGSFLLLHPSTGTPTSFDILAPSSGTPPSGSFDAAVFTFRMIGPCTVEFCPTNIVLIDNRDTLAWFDANTFEAIPVTYPYPTPVPAAAWLLGSALGVLAAVKRRPTA